MTAPSDRVQWLEDATEFAALGSEWEELADDDPFMSLTWLEAWRQSFAADRPLSVCLVWRADRLVASLPLIARGKTLEPMANDHSPSFGPLAVDAPALETLMSATLQRTPMLRLSALPRSSPLVQHDSEHWRALSAPAAFAPAVATDGSFEDWRAGSKPRWGAPLERFRRKMRRDHVADERIVERPDDLDAELAEGFAVEASGWKGRAGSAVLSSPETGAFYGRIAERFHTLGQLRLSAVRLDGDLVAFDLCLLRAERLYLLKTGFDERFRQLAPGLVLRLLTIERCFELGLRSHELLADRSEWKAKFATSERELVAWTAYGPRLAARWRYLNRRLRRTLKLTARRARSSNAALAPVAD